jgi:hypothetical protein
MPATNSVSPTGRISTGPSARYIERFLKNGGDDVVAGVEIGE